MRRGALVAHARDRRRRRRMIGDIRRRVLTEFRVDASDHILQIDKIKGKTKELETSWGSGFKALNEGINSGVEKLANFTLAFEGLAKIAEFTFDAIREQAKDMRLEMATA